MRRRLGAAGVACASVCPSKRTDRGVGPTLTGSIGSNPGSFAVMLGYVQENIANFQRKRARPISASLSLSTTGTTGASRQHEGCPRQELVGCASSAAHNMLHCS